MCNKFDNPKQWEKNNLSISSASSKRYPHENKNNIYPTPHIIDRNTRISVCLNAKRQNDKVFGRKQEKKAEEKIIVLLYMLCT